MSLCARCGLNEPLPNDPDDFCQDCAAETEAILEELEESRRRAAEADYYELEFAVTENEDGV